MEWDEVKGLLYRLARRYWEKIGPEVCAQRGVTLEDLRQECFIAYACALKGYDPQKGAAFTTYVRWHARARFRACLGFSSTRQDGLNYSDSLNVPIQEDSDLEAMDFLEDSHAEEDLRAVDQRSEVAYWRSILSPALANLPREQRKVMEQVYYGGRSRPQIARDMGVDLTEVNALWNKAIRQLRKAVRWQHFVEGAAYSFSSSLGTWKAYGSVQERIVEQCSPLYNSTKAVV